MTSSDNSTQQTGPSAPVMTKVETGRVPRLCTLLILSCLVLHAALHAQSSLADSWEGAIVLPGLDLGIIVHMVY